MFDNEQEFNGLVEQLRADEAPDSDYRSYLRRRVLTAFDEARRREARPGVAGRVRGSVTLITQSKTGKIAAAVLLLCVAGLIASLLISNGAGIALADVRDAFGRIETLTFKMSFQWGDGDMIDSEVMYMQPGKTRMEMPGGITIIDWEAGRLLALDSTTHAAHAATVSDLENPYHSNWFADLEHIVGSPEAVDIGQKDVDGRPATGWRVGSDADGVVVWADTGTAELVRVEFTGESGTAIMSDFHYDTHLDERLFSLQPPEPYRLKTQMAMKADDPDLTDVATLLRPWASGNGGIFPDKLNPALWGRAADRADWSYFRDQPETEVRAAIARAFMYLFSNARWTYAGAGVKLGDAKSPVFWAHPAPGAETCRAIFGDCEIRAVPVNELPVSP